MEQALLQAKQTAVIRTNALTRAFGALVAVDGLGLEVWRGDVFGFLGPNGSGKTTTIHMLLGLIWPTACSIELFGLNNATHLPEILPRVGAIVETPVFYPYLSGVDNLRIVAVASGMCLGRVNQDQSLFAGGGDAGWPVLWLDYHAWPGAPGEGVSGSDRAVCRGRL